MTGDSKLKSRKRPTICKSTKASLVETVSSHRCCETEIKPIFREERRRELDHLKIAIVVNYHLNFIVFQQEHCGQFTSGQLARSRIAKSLHRPQITLGIILKIVMYAEDHTRRSPEDRTTYRRSHGRSHVAFLPTEDRCPRKFSRRPNGACPAVRRTNYTMQ